MPAADRPVLAFSTLAMPGWDAERVVSAARDWGFDGVEWRGGPEGTVLTEWSARRRGELRDRVRDAGLVSIAVTAYTDFVAAHPATIQRSVDDAVAHVQLANELGAPTVRVFVGERSDDAPGDVLVDRAVGALDRVVGAARAAGVRIAIEPHDDHARSAALAPILAGVSDPALGVVWDVGNAWAAGEDPAVGHAAYAGRIAYLQVKDGTGTGESWRLCPLGRGQVPVERAIASLLGPGGAARVPPISVEWERAWHPELDPPEVALPTARAWLERVLADAGAAAGAQ